MTLVPGESEAPGGAEETRAGGRVLVVVSYFRDRSRYPRSGRAARRDAVYWANIAVNAATLRHVAGDDVDFLVCAGEAPPARAGKVLADAGAQVREVAFDHQPADDFYTRYTGSLYVFDVMEALAPEVADDDVVLLVDPDIVWVRPPDPLVADVRRGGVVAYDLGVGPDLPMCGLTRAEQGRILGEIAAEALPDQAPADDVVPRHFGGECYGMLGAELRDVVTALAPLWEATLRRYEQGRDHYHVEEHLMNAVLWRRGEQEGRANAHLHRIITLPEPFGTRELADRELVAWHLPLEKDRAFPRLQARLARGRPLPPPGSGYRRWLARRMGLEPVGARAVADRLRQVKWTLEGRTRRGTPFHGL